jgi:hypothetical protein
MSYTINDHDLLRPADKFRIERTISYDCKNVDISHFTALSVEQLHTMREESAAEEQKIFDNLRELTAVWGAQAGQTLLYDKAIEYKKVPPVTHTANIWEVTEYGHHIISNMVYKMSYHIYENTRYDRAAQKYIPYAWYVTWNIYTNVPNGNRCSCIAGQDKKRFTDKAKADVYVKGRIKAYAHLFTEISPPIPQAYVTSFCINGLLLQGYNVMVDKPKEGR